ncbi:MAG: hypothetical protein ACYST0_09960, partial [Planctomycetota bacterium]
MSPRRHLVFTVFATLFLAPAVSAQAPKYLYSPAGAATQAGGGGWSDVPWHGKSATLQQIHDYDEMARVSGGKPAAITMKGLGFRPAGKAQWLGRSWEVRLSMGQSPNSANKASVTFTTNLTNARVMFGTSTTFQKLSFQTVTGVGDPNPIAVTVPFGSTYVYVPVKNKHFCWEWRHQNGSINTPMSADVASGVYGIGTVMPSIGTGCSAWSDTNVNFQGGDYYYQNTLSGAPANTKALAMVGLQKQHTRLPGWCSNLELLPLVHVPGTTDAAGSWVTIRTPISALRGVPQFTLYMQYAFLDKRRPFGIGLSNASSYRTNLPGGWNMSRVYRSVANYTL